jgi:DNA-binding NarL/FixJ family response regulator
MEATDAAGEITTAQRPAYPMIHIVGEKSLHTELLVDYMDEAFEHTCRFAPRQNLTVAVNRFPDRTHLAFLDYNGSNKSTFPKIPDLKQAHRLPQCLLILFNVDPAHCIEMDALKRGIRGILYRHQPLDFFPKATHAVLNGELWYPRKILTHFILEQDSHPALTGALGVNLTRREREIVKKLSEGCSNREIARHFGISIQTVKTHAYNIYKKIKVHNRFQACRWLANSS